MLFIGAEMFLLCLPLTIMTVYEAINVGSILECGIAFWVMILGSFGSLMLELSRTITFAALVYAQPKTRTYLMSFCPCCGIFI